MKFCCATLKSELWNRFSSEANEDKSLVYDPVFRMYAYHAKRRKTYEESELRTIAYCPFCGSRLPYYLYDEYHLILEQALGTDEFFELWYQDPKTGKSKADQNKVPEEFKTDEWWIKRGL